MMDLLIRSDVCVHPMNISQRSFSSVFGLYQLLNDISESLAA